jgi:hypothetical protein
MQRRGKHTSVTIEEMLANGIYVGASPTLYNEKNWGALKMVVEDNWEEITTK